MSDLASQVKMLFDLMPSRIDPASAKGLTAVIQFNLTGQNGSKHYLEIDDGVATSAEGTHAEARTTITISASDFVDIIAGKLNPEAAFMTGRLKIAGDMGLAMKMQSLLKAATASDA